MRLAARCTVVLALALFLMPARSIAQPREIGLPTSRENGQDSKAEDSDNDQQKGGEQPRGEGEEGREEGFNVFGQATVVSQWHGHFRSPYEGINSLVDAFEWRTSATSTLFLGGRLWQGGEVYFNPEVAGGLGFSDVTGIAGFPNGEITRVGKPEATPYIARFWFAQTIGLGGPQETIESGPNQLATGKDISRITFALGKMAATDWFDRNQYSHDPRTQFMNWALTYNGAWDYPADVRGYDYGGVIEWNEESFALRYGLFGEPAEANGPVIDPKFSKAHGHVWEYERRYEFLDRPGALHLMAYLNRAHMGNYRRALELAPVDPDLGPTRTYDSRKYGFGLNLEQEFSDELGGFARFGWNDGHTESFAFTEIDRTMAVGLSLKGTRWRREDDVLGCAGALNGLSPDHRDFLAAGGHGFIIGDGRLNYRPEAIFELYYALQVKKGILITPDFQLVGNPGYNHDRGPVAIGTVRVHGEF